VYKTVYNFYDMVNKL